jgi:pyridoxamine 5'-phosphate oxidase
MTPAAHAGDPFVRFKAWFGDHASSGAGDPAAAALATAGLDGRPSVRIVQLAYLSRGFVFFTSYASREAIELATNPRAALCFAWPLLGRQIAAEGDAARLGDVESDEYFGTIPRARQLSAWVSGALDVALRDVEDRFANQEIPRPRTWGGFRLVPDAFEFRERAHGEVDERLRYSRDDAGVWRTELPG